MVDRVELKKRDRFLTFTIYNEFICSYKLYKNNHDGWWAQTNLLSLARPFVERD